MPDEPILRDKARAPIRTGKLPSRPPDRVIGGPGGGAVCVVCGEFVSRVMTELEIQFAHDGATRKHDSHRLHHRCFAAWEFERTKTGESGARRLSI
jgi:hypothetical protein